MQTHTIIRVKRKRGADAPDDLVVEGIGGPAKRAHTSLSSQLDTMTLGAGGAATPAASGGASRAAKPRPKRFCRLATLSAAQVSALDEAQLAQLLQQRQEALQQGPAAAAAAVTEQRQQQQQHSGSSGAAGADAGPAQLDSAVAQQQQQQQGGRYEQVRRRRRGPTAFQTTEASPDPLAAFATVYEVVRHEEEREHCRLQQPTAWQQYPEGTLMCNEQPVVRERLGDGEARKEGGHDEDEEGDEYVYDLYAAAAFSGGEGQEDEKEWWMEMHTSGRAPVVQILDDNSWLVIEGSDVSDSDADSEDSNAEGYYAHDYPDEYSEYSSGDEDEIDPEAAGLRRGGRKKGWWDESEEEGGGSGGSDGEGPWGRQSGPRPYW